MLNLSSSLRFALVGFSVAHLGCSTTFTGASCQEQTSIRALCPSDQPDKRSTSPHILLGMAMADNSKNSHNFALETCNGLVVGWRSRAQAMRRRTGTKAKLGSENELEDNHPARNVRRRLKSLLTWDPLAGKFMFFRSSLSFFPPHHAIQFEHFSFLGGGIELDPCMRPR